MKDAAGINWIYFQTEEKEEMDAYNTILNCPKVRNKGNTVTLLTGRFGDAPPHNISALQTLIITEIGQPVTPDTVLNWILATLPPKYYCPITHLKVAKEGCATFKVWIPVARAILLAAGAPKTITIPMEAARILPDPFPDHGDRFSLDIIKDVAPGIAENTIRRWVDEISLKAGTETPNSTSIVRDRVTNMPTGRIFLTFNTEDKATTYLSKVEKLMEGSEVIIRRTQKHKPGWLLRRDKTITQEIASESKDEGEAIILSPSRPERRQEREERGRGRARGRGRGSNRGK